MNIVEYKTRYSGIWGRYCNETGFDGGALWNCCGKLFTSVCVLHSECLFQHAAVSWGAQIEPNWRNHISRPKLKICLQSSTHLWYFLQNSQTTFQNMYMVSYCFNTYFHKSNFAMMAGICWKFPAVGVGEQINWSDKTFDQNQLRFSTNCWYFIIMFTLGNAEGAVPRISLIAIDSKKWQFTLLWSC